ncbi:bifunctional hydroxymethylpyrimidine kinase/phosphomethylpyrimidine kinase [Marinicauda salina]|uniref:hydroxymethylpyrimidine kinase n=1 Tax=Marinicauda salina TaxID=2135793 RepID=A0A2U2BQZ6_9PROT|nr:bifunctional hydroxymethylpyrimidine kinase/phosphomethylpyrimidine kinase [Marinicauda salina]PWE16434.1 bifunctional hydroxymethylpyrimidine kinase/phosphomethylpyrimidine kinase [Marinicauda salina]
MNDASDDIPPEPQGRVLIVAGSDSSGGAGVQADIKAVAAMGGYAATAITAITVQNTTGVSAVHAVPDDIVSGQIAAVLDDIGADIVKTGMIANPATIEATLAALDEHGPGIPLVVDPVMVASSGAVLVDEGGMEAVRDRLVPAAFLVTPNAPEAARLTGVEVEDLDGQRAAAEKLMEAGAGAALIKGGHLEGSEVVDVLATRNGVRLFSRPRIKTKHTHGTGCTTASAIAALLAQGLSLDRAVEQAGDYVHEAIRRAPGFGEGAGPINHVWPLAEAGSPFARSPVREG